MEAGATGTVRLADPDVAVTLYSEAVAMGSYAGTVTVSDRRGLIFGLMNHTSCMYYYYRYL